MSPAYSILIADAHYVAREGIRHTVLECLGKEVQVHEAGDSRSLLEAVESNTPDLCIIDYTGGGHFTVDDIVTISRKAPDIRFLVIAGSPGREDIEVLLNIPSVTGFLLKECDRGEVWDAIRHTVRGEKFYCNRILDRLLQDVPGKEVLKNHPAAGNSVSCEPVKLGAREIEVIRLIAKGLTNRQIAGKLFLSPHTVATHRKNILRKLHLNNTASVVCYAMDAGILN